MDSKDLQRELAHYTGAPLKIDGVIGPQTQGAISVLLAGHGVSGWQDWNYARRELAARQAICAKKGLQPGSIDGLTGPQTKLALDGYSYLQRTGKLPELPPETPSGDSRPLAVADFHKAPAPGRNIWPQQTDMERVFGPIGTNTVRLTPPFPMRIAWQEEKIIASWPCHEKVHDSLMRIYSRVLDHYGQEGIKKHRFDYWGGCLNPKRLGNGWSVHSYAAAVDTNPSSNQMYWNHTRATLAHPDCAMWFKIWADEDWWALGPMADYDWMHTQAARWR